MPTPDPRQAMPYRQMELSARTADGEMHTPERVRLQVEEARKQAEYFENESRRLELGNEQKALFNKDLNEVGMRIHNAVRRIEKELESMDREQRELEIARDCFQQHLKILSALQPQTWSTEGVSARLREALPKLDRAENDFNEVYAAGGTYRHTDVLRHKPGGEEKEGIHWKDIRDELLKGLAFHLPLFLLLLLTWGIYHLLTA